MDRWMIHAYVGPLFTELSVFRYVDGGSAGTFVLDRSRKLVVENVTLGDDPEEQLRELASELWRESPVWGARAAG